MVKSNRSSYLNTREITLIATFSAIWISSQVTLGPVLGTLSLGPFSMHGAVNRIVGWSLMVILAELTSAFGRVSAMAGIAALVTRVIRASPLEAVAVGAGYVVGGLVFDSIYHTPVLASLRRKYSSRYAVAASIISGTTAIIPYLLLRLSVLGSSAFLSLIPLYAYSTAKGTFLSFLGALVGLTLLPQLRKLGQRIKLAS